jgi:hypothetical protein
MTIDYITKREIQKTIMFFLTGGQTNKEVIYEKIVHDFKVSKTEVIAIAVEMKDDLPKKWRIF